MGAALENLKNLPHLNINPRVTPEGEAVIGSSSNCLGEVLFLPK